MEQKSSNTLPANEGQFYESLFQEILERFFQVKELYENYQAINRKLNEILYYLRNEESKTDDAILKDAIKEHLRGNRGPIDRYFEREMPLFTKKGALIEKSGV